jgi:hypothetical protein
MKLLTAAGRRALPALYSQEDLGYDAVAHVKFFDPCGAATWYATEFDGEDTFFGLCDLGLGFPEIGYFSLSELQSVRGPLGLRIERDLYWTPRPLHECKVAGALR